MKIFTVTKNDASQRLDRFITKNCPELPAALMFKYIRIKRIKVNGKRAQINTRLSEGDTVEAGEPLFEIETDKVVNQIEATEDGILRRQLCEEGDSVAVLTPVAIVET